MENLVRLALLALFATSIAPHACAEFLRVQGDSFYYGSNKVFLSGPNLAWYSYGYDFGNNEYARTGPTLRGWVDDISANGGNTLRIWLHVEGENTPQFDGSGFVTAPDRDGTLITELAHFLDYCAEKNVFVVIVLWNGALMRTDNYKNLILDTNKLESYLNNALRPMVRALADKPALGSWEIMNEPEGSVRIEQSDHPCYDTRMIGQHGAGWSGANVPMLDMLRFINLQASAIREEDRKALITVGSWSEHPQSDAFGDTINYYKDACLYVSGGKVNGIINYYQMHSYSWEGNWNTNSPFKHPATAYQLTKPLIIGEFSADCAMNEGIEHLFTHAYNNSYSGALSWQYNEGGHCSDNQATQNRGMQALRYRTDNGIIDVEIQ